MGNISVRPETGKLFFDFRYMKKRCREQTTLENTPANVKKLKKILERIEAEITLGSFNYAEYFPSSPMAEKFSTIAKQSTFVGDTPLFEDFAETWLGEMRIQWRDTHYDAVSRTCNKYLIPTFGNKEVSYIMRFQLVDATHWLNRSAGVS